LGLLKLDYFLSPLAHIKSSKDKEGSIAFLDVRVMVKPIMCIIVEGNYITISLYHYITIYLYHYISISLYIYIFIFILVTINEMKKYIHIPKS